jgi:hypothetical protein
VRHLRSLGVAVMAMFLLGALMAGSAMAKSGNEFEKYFSDCPINLENSAALSGCIYGEAGKESYFQAGKVTVQFVHPVKLRIGFLENEETGELKVVGARYGDSISKAPEPAPSLTEGINAELLPPAEKARYEEYLAAGQSTTVTATIELALPASDMTLNEAALLGESTETALGFPVMIHLSNKFLGKHCYVGNAVEPINVPFITGETSPPPPNSPIHGHLGKITVVGEGNILKISGADLVNNSYAAPGVTGCGTSGGLDAAINSALGLPSPAGTNATQLIGNLFQAGANAVIEHIKFSKVGP